MKNICPVCGFSHAPEEHSICPCCGTQFGYDDLTTPHGELMLRWLRGGALWFSRDIAPPLNWNAMRQLFKARLLPVSFLAKYSSVSSTTHYADRDETGGYQVTL